MSMRALPLYRDEYCHCRRSGVDVVLVGKRRLKPRKTIASNTHATQHGICYVKRFKSFLTTVDSFQ